MNSITADDVDRRERVCTKDLTVLRSFKRVNRWVEPFAAHERVYKLRTVVDRESNELDLISECRECMAKSHGRGGTRKEVLGSKGPRDRDLARIRLQPARDLPSHAVLDRAWS